MLPSFQVSEEKSILQFHAAIVPTKKKKVETTYTSFTFCFKTL